MPQIIKTRGFQESYLSERRNNNDMLCNTGYCMHEKNELLNELYTNLMEKMCERDSFSVNRTNSSWQMSK